MRGKKRRKDTPKFEECIDQIDQEIRKRRSKWNLTALSWMDFDDVSQILRIHIWKKWDLYDPSKPLCPWLNRIISNQIKNLIRNNYGNYTRPCLRCAAAEGENLCAIYEKQNDECPLYSNWEKHKKMAYNAKLPVSLENHSQEVYNRFNENTDIEKAALVFNKKMEELLKPVEWRVYSLLYIENLSESQAATRMGYKTNEQNRSPGYKQIKNLKKAIIKKAKEFLREGELDFL
jgi:RNA polymerase sigma factor (sigma-70 family)